MKMPVDKIATSEAVVWDDSPYYDDAESWTWLFWSDDHPFMPFFRHLDTTHLLELACGHGRHGELVLARFGDQVDTLVMMDILQSNVDYCLRRIGKRDDVTIIRNSGAAFSSVKDATLTAVFCYDAMVHFHREVVRSYLADTKRVLIPGGKALFHHSNYSRDPDRSFGSNPHARAYMSASLFKEHAEEAGLVLVDQKIISWGYEADLDCLSLVMNPSGGVDR